ncbi:MAG: prepilin-type N-terminal cleavage/methylation domain-containing protein [Bdellovibrionota bacterium]|nr:prepilin-type N-terminal cleavage/methylation domain-containing protein [Bdellovibrionota bacterium]
MLLKDQRAFNLLELMITVAIIGVLAGMAIPNYQAFARKARVMSTIGQLTSIAKGIVGLRSVEDKLLKDITGSTCSRCQFAALGEHYTDFDPPTTTTISRYNKVGMQGFQTDAWGQPIILNENELESDPCTQDSLGSLGNNGIYEYGSSPNYYVNGQSFEVLIPHKNYAASCGNEVRTLRIIMGPNVFWD